MNETITAIIIVPDDIAAPAAGGSVASLEVGPVGVRRRWVPSTIRAMREGTKTLAALAIVLHLIACGGEQSETGAGPEASEGELVTPPFPVRGEAEGLVLTWFDEDGAHTATSRRDIPEARRGEVRVDSLELAPDERDADSVYVADLRAPGDDGRYSVRRMPRATFDRLVETFGDAPAGTAGSAVASSDIVIFGASWCGACRQAEAYFRERGIPFIERDIETDPTAQADMQRRAAAAGIRPNGIPVIDVRGRVMQGFDRAAVERALRETAPTAPATAGGSGVSI